MEDTRRVTLDDLADATVDYLPMVPEIVGSVVRARRVKSLPASPREVVCYLLNLCGFMIFHAHSSDLVQTSMVDMALATMQLAANGQVALKMDLGFKADSLDTLFNSNAMNPSQKNAKKEQTASSKAMDYVLQVIDGDGAGVDKNGRVTINSSQERIAMACASAAGCMIGATAKNESIEKLFEVSRRFIVQGVFLADPENMKKAIGGFHEGGR